MSGERVVLTIPIERAGVAEQLIKQILDLIRRGILTAGQKLPSERELASQLGVGRPSLREALRALSLLGVVEIKQGEGVFVSSLTPESLLSPIHFFLSLDEYSLDHLFEARIVIESSMAGLAAARIDETALEQLAICVNQGPDVVDNPDRFREVDMEFHATIAEACKNPFLIRTVQNFYELGRVSRELTSKLAKLRKQSHLDHAVIFQALLERNSSGASAAMTVHLRNVQGLFRSLRGAEEHN